MKLASAVLAVCAIAAPLASSAAGNGADPYQLFRQMRVAVNQLPQPPFISFTLCDDSNLLEQWQRECVRVLVRYSDGAAVIALLRDTTGYEIPHPSPRAVLKSVYMPESTINRLGDFPLTDFGLRVNRPARRGFFDAPGTPEPAASAPPVIATVWAFQSAPYRIVDLGDTAIGGRPVHHLGLTPTRDPGHNVLREIWIDSATNLPVRYSAERFVDQDLIEPYTYRVIVDAQLVDGRLVNVGGGGWGRYGKSHWTVQDVYFPAAVPDWAFDPTTWGDHNGQHIPGLVPPG